MNESTPPSELDMIGRLGQTVLILSDIRDHFLWIDNPLRGCIILVIIKKYRSIDYI